MASDNLANRTESQAGALEEATSAIHELTSGTKEAASGAARVEPPWPKRRKRPTGQRQCGGDRHGQHRGLRPRNHPDHQCDSSRSPSTNLR
jgi:hypothetical protein